MLVKLTRLKDHRSAFVKSRDLSCTLFYYIHLNKIGKSIANTFPDDFGRARVVVRISAPAPRQGAPRQADGVHGDGARNGSAPGGRQFVMQEQRWYGVSFCSTDFTVSNFCAQFHQRSTYSFCARRDPKSVRTQSSHQYLFTLLGSTSVPVFFNLGSANSLLGSLKMLWIVLYEAFRFCQMIINFWEVPRLEKGWKTLVYTIRHLERR